MAILLAILIAIIALIVFLAVLIKNKLSNKLESIALTPTFAETELDVNQDYTFTIQANPEKAKLKDLEYITDASNVSFEASGDGTAVMHTFGEGVVTVCVKMKDIESNYLQFSVVDHAAQEAAKAAEEAAAAEAAAAAAAEEAAAAEAEAAANAEPVEVYVRANDKVRIRQSPNTDSNDNILSTCEIGDVFLRTAIVDDWSRIVFNDKDAYIKSEFLDILSDEEAAEAQENQKAQSVEEALKMSEEAAAKANANDPVAAAAAEAAKAQDEAAKAAADAAAAEAAAAQVAAAQAAAAAPSGSLPASGAWSYGGITFTPGQVAYFHGLWDYTGDAAEFVTHHSAGELLDMCQKNGIN